MGHKREKQESEPGIVVLRSLVCSPRTESFYGKKRTGEFNRNGNSLNKQDFYSVKC